MLKILRNKKTAKKIWIGLAIIIIPAFTLWGFGSSSRNREENAVTGRIFGRNVSSLEFKESLSAVRANAIMRFGDKLPEIEKYLNLQAQAWERLILLDEAKTRKISARDKEIIETIQSAPYFQDKKGGFNNKTYVETLRYYFRLQPRIFEEQTRQNLILGKLYSQITDGIKIEDSQIRQEWLKTDEELSIYYIAGLFAEFAKKIKPNKKEISAYYDKNKDTFKEPPAKDKPARIPELAEIKEKVKDALAKEESKKMAENKIKEYADKLKTKPFNQLVKVRAYGFKAGQTKFFKPTEQLDNLGEAQIFWDTAKQLKENQVSDIFSDANGCYIIKLKAIKPVDEDKFAKEKKELGDNILSREKSKAFGKFVEETKKKAE